MKTISLDKGYVAIIDDENYEEISKHKWRITGIRTDTKLIYAVRYENKKAISMHRTIMDAKKHEFIDHVNHDGLDNRKDTLRKCTHSENMRNRIKTKKSASMYKGVKRAKLKWRACIGFNRKKIHLGLYDTEHKAAMAYNEAAIRYHGNYACLNKL